MSTANGTVAGFTTTDVGMPAQAGLTFSCTNGEFEITAGGADIGGAADQGHVALKSLGGDFDLKVRVVGVTPVNSAAEAGLMVRESLDAGSPTLHLLANPPPPSGRGWIEAGRRATADGGTVSWGTTFTAAVMPDVWLRLRRAGDVFQGFYATNGTDWMLLAQTAQVFPDLVFVGMAASAHNNSAPATLAQFMELGDVVFSGVTLNITQPPVATSAEQNSIATFTATAEGVGAPANELIYQWQRGDGLGGFTNVLGANESTLSFLARPEDADAQFRVRVYFAGLVETSAAATLTVTPDSTPPTIEAVRARGNPNALTIEFSEAISISTATDPFNYMIVNLNTGEGVSFSLPTLGVDGRTVTLTTDPLEDGLDYLLSVSGIQDLGAPPNTVAEGTQVQFTYSSLVGHWQFEEGAGLTTADATGSGFTGTLLNGPVWVAGRIGQGALKFDGADDRVDVGNPPAFHITGPITLAAWVWVDSIADNGRIVTKGGASGQRGWSLNVEGTEVWAFQIAVNSTTSLSLNLAGIPRNEWIHVAGVYDPSVPILRFYTNGILGGERTDSVPTTQFDSPLNVSIGARPNNQTWFDGRIDEVRIYTRALTDVEIAVLAQPPVVQPQFLPPTVSDGQIHLNWTGTGQLEWAPTVNGPWTAVTPPPSSSYSEAIVIGTNRFYRINAGP